MTPEVISSGIDIIFQMLRQKGSSAPTVALNIAIEMQKNPDMEHDDPNAKRLAPKKTGEIVWAFTKPGEFDFSCLIPGHREAGMTGKIVVK